MPVCNKCGQSKPDSHFYKSSKSRCKECIRDYSRNRAREKVLKPGFAERSLAKEANRNKAYSGIPDIIQCSVCDEVLDKTDFYTNTLTRCKQCVSIKSLIERSNEKLCQRTRISLEALQARRNGWLPLAGRIRQSKYIGRVFGRLLIVGKATEKHNTDQRKYFSCLCLCGKRLDVHIRSLNRGDQKSCGCLHSENADKLRGSGSGSRSWTAPKSLRRAITRRTGGLCELCQANDGTQQIHHLDSKDWCPEKKKTTANCILICSSHHRDFHDEFGYGGNTREQFDLWCARAGYEAPQSV